VTDQELIAVLDSRFGTLAEQLDGRFAQIDRRFEQIDARFEQIDARFEQIDARFEQIDRRFEQIDRRFEQIDRRFDRVEERLTRVETDVLHAFVQIEALRDETKRIAESVILVDEKLERFRAETTVSFTEQKAFNQMLLERIA